MGHYTGPKARVNRRLGFLIYESSGAKRASDRRDSPPGMHVRRGKLSDYGVALREKQKIKYYYGLSERQLRRLYDIALRKPGNTGETLLILCEMRLDNIIRLAGLTKTRPQARQGAAHGHFLVNGHKNDVASTLLRPGDVIYVKPRPGIQAVYASVVTEYSPMAPHWLDVDYQRLTVRVSQMPTIEDVTLPVNVGSVIELLSR